MPSVTYYRLVADFCHIISKGILIGTIHRYRSAEGISLLTQALYALVFCTRYLDLFLPESYRLHPYNFIYKIIYLATSFYILFLMLRVYPRSREAEKEWRITGYILAFAVVAAPIFQAIFGIGGWSILDTLRNFSFVVESLAVLPQLVLLAHTSIPTVLNSYYLLALGVYRLLYIPNWIVRSLDKNDHYLEPTAIIFGVVQSLLYVEFAWIYWSRQKVKLRNGGGVLDGEEFARGLVLGRIIGGDDGKAGGRETGGSWRGQGLSISANDFVVAEEGGDFDDDDSGDELQPEEDVETGLIGRRERG